MNYSELYGTLVLVSPGIRPDTGEHRGKVGIITYLDSEADVHVTFKDGEGKFPSLALSQLKPREEMLSSLIEDASSLTVNDFKDLYKISVLQDMGRSTDIWQALEIAAKNVNILDKALNGLPYIRPVDVQQSLSRR